MHYSSFSSQSHQNLKEEKLDLAPLKGRKDNLSRTASAQWSKAGVVAHSPAELPHAPEKRQLSYQAQDWQTAPLHLFCHDWDWAGRRDPALAASLLPPELPFSLFLGVKIKQRWLRDPLSEPGSEQAGSQLSSFRVSVSTTSLDSFCSLTCTITTINTKVCESSDELHLENFLFCRKIIFKKVSVRYYVGIPVLEEWKQVLQNHTLSKIMLCCCFSPSDINCGLAGKSPSHLLDCHSETERETKILNVWTRNSRAWFSKVQRHLISTVSRV